MKTILNLTLDTQCYADGTNGTLSFGDRYISQTIELPWLNNHPQVSCIPAGRYQLKARYTDEKGHHFSVLNVPGRADILFHAANTALTELRGCVAPVSRLTGHGKGDSSRPALAKMVALCYPILDAGGEVWVDVKRHLNTI